jgi:OmpA-OmpF porin, OOP family
MTKLAIPFALAAAIGCTSAYAQQWYFGIGAGRASLGGGTTLETTSTMATTVATGTATLTSYSFSPTQFGGHDTALTARYGWRFHRNMALELGYYDLGKYSFDIPVADPGVRTIRGSATARSYGLSFVGILPIDRADLYARVGYARTEVKSSADSGNTTSRGRIRENEAYGAVGARWNFNSTVGVFAEYQKHDKLDINGYFAGLDYRF